MSSPPPLHAGPEPRAGAMEVAAGDSRTTLILQRKYNRVGCMHCGAPDHIHHACPKRPCYLCKREGHQAPACPFRALPGAHEALLRALLRSRVRNARAYYFLQARETEPTAGRLHPSVLQMRTRQFDARRAAGGKFHAKRVTALEWDPRGRVVVSGDKRGGVRLWNVGKWAWEGFPSVTRDGKATNVFDVHRCNVTNFAWDPAEEGVCYSSSADGTVCRIQLEVQREEPPGYRSNMEDGSVNLVHDMNPLGWGGTAKFKMAYGLAYDGERRCLYVGASEGSMLRLDPREGSRPSVMAKFHKDKITTLDVNRSRSDLLATASNDRTAQLWDARKLVPDHSLGSYKHEGVVSSAYFSPNTGSRLLTTSTDNKIRVWNDVHAFVGAVDDNPHAAPVEIVHSHNFNRYLNAFRASWDPKDWRDDLFVCGRCLGDSYTYQLPGYDNPTTAMLYPIDLFSAQTGTLVHSLIDYSVNLICTTNRFCPTEDIIATAASGNVILWAPPSVRYERKRQIIKEHNEDTRRRDKDGRGGDAQLDEGDDARNPPAKRVKYVLSSRLSKRKKQDG